MALVRIMFLRVSKENEAEQRPEDQKPKILAMYNLAESDFDQILIDRGSAYDKSKIEEREHFLKIIDILTQNGEQRTKDVFLNRIKELELELYVWDISRVFRDFELNLWFGLLCNLQNVKIYSYKHGDMSKQPHEKPAQKFTRFVIFSANAFSAEDYSHNISENVKKSTSREVRSTVFSTEGNKWGNQFTTGRVVDGVYEIKKLTPEEVDAMNKMILRLCREFEHKKQYGYYPIVIERIKKNFDVELSKGYITKIRKLYK